MRQIRIPYIPFLHPAYSNIEFEDEGVAILKRLKSRPNTSIDDAMKQLVTEGCRRDISIDRRFEIRSQLTLLRRQMRAKRSRLA